ncbi:MAG TPA: hypothetical protein VK498_03515 [Ferruginibacter sp.]|nr:hypothetical protein [Ferruginibacter sp.]
MKRFLKGIAIFLLPLLIFCIFSEILLRRIPNDYKYKKKYLDINSRYISTLFLGSSHAFFSINPDFIKSNSFNVAYVSQSLDYDLEILNKYHDKWDSLTCIVIPVDYFSLFTKLETSVEAWRIKNYTLYYGININNNISYYSEILSNNLKVNSKRLYNYYFRHHPDISCSMLGWGTDYNSKSKKDLESTGVSAARRHTAADDKEFRDNLEILQKIIDFAHEKNINVLLFTSPAYKSYVHNLDSTQLKQTISAVSLLTLNNNNTEYHNFLNDPSFNESDFYDADHLNVLGAKKFTLKIDSLISKENGSTVL